MGSIFVDTDNSNAKAKLYDGHKAGASAEKAEAKIGSVVKNVVDKAAGFTTDKTESQKGYTIRIWIKQIEVENHQTTVTLEGTIVRFPKGQSKHRGKGEEMVNLGVWGNHGTASGTGDGPIVDATEAVVESMMKTAPAAMSRDMMKR